MIFDMTHSYVWYNSWYIWHGQGLVNATSLSHWYVKHDLLIRDMTYQCVTWPTHPWHDSFIRVTWLVYFCDVALGICDMGRHRWMPRHPRAVFLVCECVCADVCVCVCTTFAGDIPSLCLCSSVCCITLHRVHSTDLRYMVAKMHRMP